MDREERAFLVSRSLFTVAASLLLFLGTNNPISAQAGSISTPSTPGTLQPSDTPTSEVTSTMISTPTPTVTIASEAVTYKDLTEHFESVTTRTLNIFTVVIAVAGGLGVFVGIKGWQDIRNLTKEIDSLITQQQSLRNGQEKLWTELSEAERQARSLTSRLRYVLEIRDKNVEVRIRAAQQLGASNDIAAVSILIESLESDRSNDVKIEAAYGLGLLLSTGREPETLTEGIRALVAGTRDDSDKVRGEAVEALDNIVCSNVILPRAAVQRLREILQHEKFTDVIEAARIALEHIQIQRENRLTSQGQNSGAPEGSEEPQ